MFRRQSATPSDVADQSEHAPRWDRAVLEVVRTFDAPDCPCEPPLLLQWPTSNDVMWRDHARFVPGEELILGLTFLDIMNFGAHQAQLVMVPSVLARVTPDRKHAVLEWLAR